MSRIFEAVLKRAGQFRASDTRTRKGSVVATELCDRRCSRRSALDVAVYVYGYGLGEIPFHEKAHTLSVSANGGRLLLGVPVCKGQKLLLTNEATLIDQECRIVNIRPRGALMIEVGVAFPSPQPAFWQIPGRLNDADPMRFEQAGAGTLSPPAEPHWSPDPATHSPAPRFCVPRAKVRRNLLENILALLRGPTPPRESHGHPYFRDCWVSAPLPHGAILASLLWHVTLLLLLVPLWKFVAVRSTVPLPQEEIAWYGPITDLPAILLRGPVPKPNPPRETERPVPQRGADAFHPRQTIVNSPSRPNHPRQTLIQLAAPPEPPKILPALPNIVGWIEPSRPQLWIDPAALTRLRPKTPVAFRKQPDAPLPEVPTEDRQLAALNISAFDAKPEKPSLQILPMSTPKVKTMVKGDDQAVPEIGVPSLADPGGTRVVALSDRPAPVPPPAVPAGSLSSNVSISPDGLQPGSPGDSPSMVAPSTNGGNGFTGPRSLGLSISGGDEFRSSLSGVGIGGPAMTRMSAPKSREAPNVADHTRRVPLAEQMQPGVAPESLLGPKHVNTLYINMPNLTSATGSWQLSFVELDPAEPLGSVNDTPADLSGPEPLRKVDPKYPPELRSERVQGEVVLYAIIRRDGTVDSIELIKGIDPTLDINAMRALGQWKFRPAERKGLPLELEAIVHVPFRAVALAY